MRCVLVLLSCNCGHLSSVSMFMKELVLWNLLQPAGVSGRSALDHFEFTDVRFGMRVPDTATSSSYIKEILLYSVSI